MQFNKLVQVSCRVFALAAFLPVGEATASEWGCEVLLCASSSNPSWRGVSACNPPMTKLIAAMQLPGFDWPTCPEAGTGSPGYRAYDQCPAGYSLSHSMLRNGINPEPDLCTKTENICTNAQHDIAAYNRDSSCIQTISIPRPRRSEPYYFDIKNDTSGRTERHWFELND